MTERPTRDDERSEPARAPVPRLVVLRVDDVASLRAVQDQLVHELCRAVLHVTCAVIPSELTPECAAFLRFTARCFPRRLELHQHGWSHADHSGGRGEAHEFGPARTREQQLADLVRGRRILEDAFGDLFFPAFTPPFGRYDRTTLYALAEAGFRVISGTAPDPSNDVLPECAPSIDTHRWDPMREKAWAEIHADWVRQRAPTGFVFHPHLTSLELTARLATDLPVLLRTAVTVPFARLCGP